MHYSEISSSQRDVLLSLHLWQRTWVHERKGGHFKSRL
jgi:hypothetical protein